MVRNSVGRLRPALFLENRDGHLRRKASWPCSTLFGFFDDHSESHEFLAIHFRDGALASCFVLHFNKAKALALPSVPVGHHLDTANRAHGTKPFQQTDSTASRLSLATKSFMFVYRTENGCKLREKSKFTAVPKFNCSSAVVTKRCQDLKNVVDVGGAIAIQVRTAI